MKRQNSNQERQDVRLIADISLFWRCALICRSVLCLVFLPWSGPDSCREFHCSQVKRRVDAVIKYVFLHKGVLEDKSYGFMHLFYFYGFLI